MIKIIDNMLNCQDDKWIEHYSKQILLKNYDNDIELSNLYRKRSSHYFSLCDYNKCKDDLERSENLFNDIDNLVSFSFIYEKLKDYNKGLECLIKYKAERPEEEYIDDYINNLRKVIEFNNDNLIKNKFVILRKWVLDNGGNLDLIKVNYQTNDNREILSSNNILMDDKILRIPLKCLITTELGKETNIGKEVLEKDIKLFSNHNWITFVLLETFRDKDSYFYSYVDIMPKEFNNVPINFSEYYIKKLSGSQCIENIDNKRKSLMVDYVNLKKNIDSFRNYNYNDYVWARTVVITRIYGIIINNKKTQALVPFADMLNHKIYPKTRWTFNDKDKFFEIISKGSILKDSPISDSYGCKCNSRFFVNYGFVLDSNIDNESEFIIDLNSNDFNLVNLKAKLQYPSYKFGTLIKSYNNFVNFLSIIRYYICEDIELIKKPLSNFLVPISIENEILVLKHLLCICIKHLKKYSSSLKEDSNVLLDPLCKYNYHNSNIRNCISIMYGEKLIYDYYMKLALLGIKILRKDFLELIKTKLLLDSLNGIYKRYISENICILYNFN